LFQAFEVLLGLFKTGKGLLERRKLSVRAFEETKRDENGL
jgi:hypothetical protein